MLFSRIRHAVRFIVLNAVARSFLVPRGIRSGLYRLGGVRVGHHVYIFPGVVVRPGNIRIGDGSFLNHGVVLDPGRSSIWIGDRCAIGSYSTLVGNSHEIGHPRSRAGREISAPIRIGDGTWLGANSVVMPGVTIAPGCVIGAGSIVTRDTARDGVYLGAPARRIRSLPGEQLPADEMKQGPFGDIDPGGGHAHHRRWRIRRRAQRVE